MDRRTFAVAPVRWFWLAAGALACIVVAVLTLVTWHPDAPANGKDSRPSEISTVDTAWFSAARYGLFIHWGLYSRPAGRWKGKDYFGASEWLMYRARIPVREYAELAREFDPNAFDAKAWVAFAKQAGFRYIVITAKHHDGFAMFDSRASHYDIVDATPFGRDPLKELAAEAQRQGMPIGFYYSQYQDWADPNASGNDWDFRSLWRDFDTYQEEKADPQLRELLTGYGPVAIVWFDTPNDISREGAERFLRLVRELQPRALVSSRLGQGLGDYEDFRDGEIPVAGESKRPWEALFPLGESWGYSTLDQNFKSPAEIIRTLATVAGQGGNMLLNIGPDATGRLPWAATSRMLAAGQWLRRNGESIYGTGPSPFGPMPWGTATTRPGTLYLHVFERPRDGRLVLPETSLDVVSVTHGGEPLPWTHAGDSVLITLPQNLPDAWDTVLTIRHRGAIRVARSAAILGTMPVALDPFLAERAGQLAVLRQPSMGYFGVWSYFPTFAGMHSPRDNATWRVNVLEPGDYRVTIEYIASVEQAERTGSIEVGPQRLRFAVLESGELRADRPPPFVTQRVGTLRFDKPGVHRIRLRPDTAGREPLFTFKEMRIEQMP